MSVYAIVIEKLLKRNARLADERDALVNKIRALEKRFLGKTLTPKRIT